MRFTHVFTYGTAVAHYEAGEIVERLVEHTERDGELETMRARIDKLAEIVGVMADLLSDEQKTKLADRFGYAPTKEYAP